MTISKKKEEKILTDKDIRNAVAILRESDIKELLKTARHYQHTKKDRGYYALRGCPDCLKLVVKSFYSN